MDFAKTSVLIFGAAGRQALPVCRGFFELGCRVVCYCFNRWDEGYLTRYKTERIVYDRAEAGGMDFYSYGMRLIRENRYSLVVPLNDKCARYLSQHKAEIDPGTKVAVNDWAVQEYASDKAKTMAVCAAHGIPAPKTICGENLAGRLDEIDFRYPVVVKPRTGIGSIGFNILRSREKLERYLASYDAKNGPLLIQEYIRQGSHPQYRADLFRTKSGEFKAATVGRVTRWYPLDGGSGIFVISVHDDAILDSCRRLLDAVGWVGYANIDLIMDEETNTAKILEINGRTGASILIDYVCGINMSRLMLENALDLPVTDYTAYPDGKRISCFAADLMWFLKSKDRFRAKPSWFSRIGVKDVIFSWNDPLPAVGFFVKSVRKFDQSVDARRRFDE